MDENKMDSAKSVSSSPETEILDELLEDDSSAPKEVIRELAVSMHQMRMETSPSAEVMKKLTSEHIGKYLDASQENMQREYRDKNYNRIFFAVMAALMMAFVVIIVVLLKDTHPEMLEKVIYAGGGLVAGLFGGYGIGKSRNID